MVTHNMDEAAEYASRIIVMENGSVLIIGGVDDPISTPDLMMRTAKCLPNCKLVIYSNCGHDIDTDIIEEVSGEADRFLKNALERAKCYDSVSQL